jgi:7-carboxy-7-deazaguanine synthase
MNLWTNIEHLKSDDEVKFVIGSREDYEWAKQKIAEFKIADRCKVLMSVVFDKIKPAQVAEWVLVDKLNVRFQLQIHKYIWDPHARGV